MENYCYFIYMRKHGRNDLNLYDSTRMNLMRDLHYTYLDHDLKLKIPEAKRIRQWLEEHILTMTFAK